MKSHPLDGVRAKIVRAEQHLDAVREAIAAHKPKCGLISKKDADPDWIAFYANFPDPPLSLSTVIGDCLHNLRCALDHIVWQLVLRDRNNPSTSNMFPICETVDGFRRQVTRGRLAGITSRNVITLIESLQPYHRVNNVQDDPLWRLNHLANIDKHRTLTITTTEAYGLLVETVHPDIAVAGRLEWQAVLNQPLRNNAGFFRVKFAELFSGLDIDEVTMNIKQGVQVTFQDEPFGDSGVDYILADILNLIQQLIIPSFEPFF